MVEVVLLQVFSRDLQKIKVEPPKKEDNDRNRNT